MFGRFLVVLGVLWAHSLGAEIKGVQVKAESAILINADTGTILYQKNPHKKLFPSSTTKIATALYTLKVQGHRLDRMLTAEQDCIGWASVEAKKRSQYTLPAYWLENGGTHMNIKKGETLSLDALMYGMMLVSANDAANVIARYVGGTVPDFMKELNAYLVSIGCKDTHFVNPHGLHHPHHETTANDLALMTREALKNQKFREIVISSRATRPKTNMQEEGALVQGNMLLRRGKHRYTKAIGVKTGSTSMAKNCLVSAASHQGRTLIAVLMKSPSRDAVFSDSVRLFEKAFHEPKEKVILMPKGSLNVRPKVGGEQVEPYLKKPIIFEYFPSEKPEVTCAIKWESLQLPIDPDTLIGYVHVQNKNKKILGSHPLYVKNKVGSGTLFFFKSFFSSHKGSPSPFSKFVAVTLLLSVFGTLLWKLRR